MKHLSVQSSMNGLKSPVILLCFNSSGARVADTCTKTLCHYFFWRSCFCFANFNYAQLARAGRHLGSLLKMDLCHITEHHASESY